MNNEAVRFCDATTRLALIRVPREFCSIVRASVTLLTAVQNQRVSVTVLSVSGSARTAKVDAIRLLRRYYREKMLRLINDKGESILNRRETGQICRSMQDALETIVSIDY